MRELPHEAGLPHAGLPHEGHDLAVAGVRLGEGLAQGLQLRLPAHEAGEAPGGGGLEAGAGGGGPEELEDLHGVGQALDRDGPQGGDLDEALGQPEGLGRQADASGGRELFHAGRQVRGLADGGVVHVQVAADGPDHHLAGVEAHPDLDLDAVGAADLLGVAANGPLHGQGGVAGPDGVVLVGQRGTEEGHDPVAHHLVHRALVPVDGLHHVFEDGIQKLSGLLGVAVRE